MSFFLNDAIDIIDRTIADRAMVHKTKSA